jgi:bifunctional non-homologous end joining protein LigD
LRRRSWSEPIKKEIERARGPLQPVPSDEVNFHGTRDWLKFKCRHEQEFAIGRGKLVYAGKVGTGFELQHLSRRLAQLETSTSPFGGNGVPLRGVHWVKPKLVAQIGFTEWTSGDKLRHPRFLGIREDKKPEDVVREG